MSYNFSKTIRTSKGDNLNSVPSLIRVYLFGRKRTSKFYQGILSYTFITVIQDTNHKESTLL